ncbi:Monothiol glutaredoxin-S2 [Lathyrus oleraceus]|uniref:Monothiol glutaredoxin-S2 n=1 Tax=Pisum sativum TaxID=3888 RepID=A0A9D4X957_PEA|nr:Monothiol glutaredoxin-S2 [Pisum sativum]
MSNKKIVISRDVIVDEFRQFDSRKSAISVLEINLPQDEIDFMQENQHSGAVGTGSGEVEIDLPQGEIDFMQENLNSQLAEGTVQQPFVTETGESSKRPTRQRGLPQRLPVYELDEISRGREIEQALLRFGSSPSVPTVLIGGELVGGANQVMSLHLNRSLIPMLKKAGALWV